MTSEKVRIDKFLWSIRLFKTRTLATEACDTNKVKMNDQSVKPSKTVALGDRYEIRTQARKWVIRVIGLVDKRVAYEEAIKCYEDLTPEEDKVIERYTASFHTGKRLSKTGKPTKKQRRDIGDFLDEG